MKYWIKLLVTVVLAVSIPLQGFAAVMMPACNTSSASINDNMSMSVHSTTTMTATDHATAQAMPCDGDCCKPASKHKCSDQKCFMCHLSMFSLTDTHLLVLTDNTAMTYQDLISESYQIDSPPLFHPPKPLFA